MKHYLTFEHYATICPISSAFLSDEPKRIAQEMNVDIIPFQLIDTHYQFFGSTKPAYTLKKYKSS